MGGDRLSTVVSGKLDAVTVDLADSGIPGKFGRIQCRIGFAIAEIEIFFTGLGGTFFDDRQSFAGGMFEMIRQFLRGIGDHRNRIIRNYDSLKENFAVLNNGSGG